MANISKIDRKAEKQKQQAAKNRREIISAGLSRREMVKMGLLTTAGLLVPLSGLSVRARNSAGHLLDSGPGSGPSSPPTTPFVQPFTRMTVKRPVACAPVSTPMRLCLMTGSSDTEWPCTTTTPKSASLARNRLRIHIMSRGA